MKRLIDILVSFITLVFIFPILILIMVMIRLNMGAPVFFIQSRPGFRGAPFKLVKFRTMSLKYNKKGSLLSDNQRLNFLGSILRSSSLDELPNLWNVLVGKMSLVGPRPLLIEYLPLYNAKQAKRHDVRPGITGWAQVNGRNSICWEDKFTLDVWYVENHSLWLDFKIIVMTVKKVFFKNGINAQEDKTMPKFTGNEKL